MFECKKWTNDIIFVTIHSYEMREFLDFLLIKWSCFCIAVKREGQINLIASSKSLKSLQEIKYFLLEIFLLYLKIFFYNFY